MVKCSSMGGSFFGSLRSSICPVRPGPTNRPLPMSGPISTVYFTIGYTGSVCATQGYPEAPGSSPWGGTGCAARWGGRSLAGPSGPPAVATGAKLWASCPIRYLFANMRPGTNAPVHDSGNIRRVWTLVKSTIHIHRLFWPARAPAASGASLPQARAAAE